MVRAKSPAVFVALAMALALSLAPLAASAATITIQTEINITPGPEAFVVNVAIKNAGDAPAYDVRARLAAMEDRLVSEPIDMLRPGQTQNVDWEKPWEGPPRGRFPLVLLVEYADDAGYRFSALHCAAFGSGQDPPQPKLLASLSGNEITGHGRVALSVTNTGAGPLKVKARLILPHEFTSRDRVARFPLAPGAGHVVSFDVENLTALPGAAYPVYAFAEYEHDGLPQTVAAQAVVRVGSPEHWFRRTRAWWIALAVLLIVALAAGALFRRKKPIQPGK